MRKYLSFVFVTVFLFAFSFVGAFSNVVQTHNPSINSLYSSSDISTYWPSLSSSIKNGECTGGTDFLVTIPINGCSPSVVRSDLLAEQNVPVFCKLIAVNVNPLIDVSKIDSISFKGAYPKDVISVSYHPAKAAIESTNDALLGSPVVNDIGYVVIVLKKTANESAMKEWIYGNLTATMHYDAKDAYGVGQSEFYLKSITDDEWDTDYVGNSFWNGKGFLRLKDINGENARISVYTGKDDVYTEVQLKEGETSGTFYFPGSYCQSGLKVKLNSIVSDKDSALLDVDGNSVWVREGSKFLDGACTVSKLNVGYGSTGTITFSCRGSKSTTLSLTSKNVATIGEKSYEIGDVVSQGTKKNLYLGYVGATESALWEEGNRKVESGIDFVVLVNESSQVLKLDSFKVSKISDAIANFFGTKKALLEKKAFENAIKRVAGSDAVVLYNVAGLNGASPLVLNSVEGRTTSSEIGEAKIEIQKYFDKMDGAQNELTDLYPQEGIQDPFGAFALASEIKILKNMASIGMADFGKVAKLIEKFEELYPSSDALSNLKQSSEYDYTRAYSTVYTNNNYRKISVLRFKEVDKDTKTAQFSYDGGYQEIKEGDIIYVGEEEESDYFVVKSIERNVVSVAYYKYVKNKFNYQSTYELREDTPREINKNSNSDVSEYTLRVDDISVVEVASVSLISNLDTSSEANFTYRIGVEQRAIKISPKKATEMADKLNDTIKEWEERNAKLGKLVKTWKGACLLTSAALQVKTLFNGFSGEGSARQNVMKIYKDECRTNDAYKDMTTSECYAKLNEENSIDNDVEAYKNAIEKSNTDLKGKNIEQWQASCGVDSVYSEGESNVVCKDLNSWADIKLYLLNKYISVSMTASNSLIAKTKTEFETRMKVILMEKKSLAEAKKAETSASVGYSGSIKPSVQSDNDASSVSKTWDGQKAGDLMIENKKITEFLKSNCSIDSIKDETPIQYYVKNDKLYLLVLTTSSSTSKKAMCILNVGGDSLNQFSKFDRPNQQGDLVSYNTYNYLSGISFVGGTTGSCRTGYASDTKFNVEFYESGVNKGNPAKVPFDKKNGWYVRVSSSTGGIISDQVKSYQDSGAVSYFKICNVGENQVEDGNDKCSDFYINSPIGNRDNVADCRLSSSEIESLVRDAQLAIRQAQQNYGKKSFAISVGGRGAITVSGSGAVSDLGYQCEDFMSIDDCHIMYNVCDPVICPSSRCDFGGKMKVANVIQSGIVGSVLLCLPNFGSPSNGGVLIPVCLTGIHAGIEGYVSILKSEQKCLIEAAKTGAHTGICDEVTAVYKCEFFWRQVSPLMDNLIPALAEIVMTGGVEKKGGGEYLTFQDSWENMEKSIDYFKNSYASTSFAAFEFGNVEEIGSEVCQNFIGVSAPTSGDVMDSLLKPESPYQFYAQFSEIELTDATLPATSQYKVYYHIYAGNDQGISYQVYLKDPIELKYVGVPERVYVDTGYVAIGEEVDKTEDFSAPAGYKQLCVVINNQEECGFKSVTTDVGLDMLHDSYVKDQVEDRDIKTEKECSLGTSSVYSLLNLNLQEGVDETINPDIALSGIVRVCSTKNPGSGDKDANWVNVGYCGDSSVICWLDKKSLEEGVYNILNASESVADAKEVLENGAKSLTSAESKTRLDAVYKNITELVKDLGVDSDNKLNSNSKKDVEKIETLIGESVLYSNNQKAKLIYLEFGMYEKIVDFLIKKANGGKTGATTDEKAPVAPEKVEETEITNVPAYEYRVQLVSGSNDNNLMVLAREYNSDESFADTGLKLIRTEVGGEFQSINIWFNSAKTGAINSEGKIYFSKKNIYSEDLVNNYVFDNSNLLFRLENS